MVVRVARVVRLAGQLSTMPRLRPIPFALLLITAAIQGVVSQCSATLQMVTIPPWMNLILIALGQSIHWPDNNGWLTRSRSLDTVVGSEHP